MKYAITVRSTKKKGRGCFALKNFRKGEIIEKCPLLLLTRKECTICERTLLDYYIYAWNKPYGAILLGYGFIYNHSEIPNAVYERDYHDKFMVYRAIKPIHRGEEVCVNYNGRPDDTTPIPWLRKRIRKSF